MTFGWSDKKRQSSGGVVKVISGAQFFEFISEDCAPDYFPARDLFRAKLTANYAVIVRCFPQSHATKIEIT
jgi:hypothetical protein